MSIWQYLTCQLMFPPWAFQMTQHRLLACEAQNAGSPKDSWLTKSAEMKTTMNKRLSFMTIMCHYYVKYLTIHSHHIKKEARPTSPGVDCEVFIVDGSQAMLTSLFWGKLTADFT